MQQLQMQQIQQSLQSQMQAMEHRAKKPEHILKTFMKSKTQRSAREWTWRLRLKAAAVQM
jgi:hypothetical protein